jgi:hypothetical protein
LGRWALGFRHSAKDLPEDMAIQHIVDHPFEVLLPMVVGGIPTAIVAWFVFFWPLQRAVAEYQKARKRRLRKRLRRTLDAATKYEVTATAEAGQGNARKIESQR